MTRSSAREVTSDPGREHHLLGSYRLAASTQFGPRVTGLWAGDSGNLFAVLDDDVRIRNPEVGDYRFHGGHRLWVAPENPEITHVPDDATCLVTSHHDLLRIAGDADRAGFTKTIEVRSENDRLVVDHALRYVGGESVVASPWAITQLPLGGTAIFPLDPDDSENDGYTADRTVVLWPYTRLDDPRIEWRDRVILIDAAPGSPLKIGAGPEARRLGYLRQNRLFVKWFPNSTSASHADRGATAQIFVNQDFCELETLGPLVDLEPGSTLSHREFWEVSECPTIDAAIEALAVENGS